MPRSHKKGPPMIRKLLDLGDIVGSFKIPEHPSGDATIRLINMKMGGAVIQLEGKKSLVLLRDSISELYPVDSKAAPLAKAGAVFSQIEALAKGLHAFAEEQRWPESIRETIKHLNDLAVNEQEKIRIVFGGSP